MQASTRSRVAKRGRGAPGASDEVADLANRPGSGVAKTLLGKAVLRDDLARAMGTMGHRLPATKPSYYPMIKCDTLPMIVTGFPYAKSLSEEGQAAHCRQALFSRA